MHVSIPRIRAVFALSLVAVYALSTATVTARTMALVESQDTIAIVTGGGTVFIVGTSGDIASFGFNSQRPAGFTVPSGGEAQGRINYDKHQANTANRHVNVPVMFMTAATTSTPPNNTGGTATLIGNCDGPGGECPPGFHSVKVTVTDSTDSGQGDIFQISYCVGTAQLAPTQCQGTEGSTLRSGNVQIRPAGSGGGNGPASAVSLIPR